MREERKYKVGGKTAPGMFTSSEATRPAHATTQRDYSFRFSDLTSSFIRPGESPGPAIELPKFAIVNFIAAESLILARNPQIDPFLNSWLDRHTEKAKLFNTNEQRAGYITAEVKKIFGSTYSKFLHPIRAKRFKEMLEQKNEYALLGDFMKNRTGNCRHHWALTQMALQELGIIAVPMIGNFSQSFAKDGAEFRKAARHITTLALLDGNATLLDSNQEKQISIRYHSDANSAQELFDEGVGLRLSTVMPLFFGDLRCSYRGEKTAIDAFLASPIPEDQENILEAINRSPQHVNKK